MPRLSVAASSLLLVAGLSNACTNDVTCDYDLEGNPVNCTTVSTGGGGSEPLPVIPSLAVLPTLVDDGWYVTSGIAAGGHDLFHYQATEVSQVTASVGAPFTVTTGGVGAADGPFADVVANAPGTSTLELAGTGADGVAVAAIPQALTAIPVATVGVETPLYAPQLGAPPRTFLGSNVSLVAHLYGGHGEDLVDTSMSIAASGASVFPIAWDYVSVRDAMGPTNVAVTASSIGVVSVPIVVVDHLDQIEFTDTLPGGPGDRSDHLVCAYGVSGAEEVATTWFFGGVTDPSVTFTTVNANCAQVHLQDRSTSLSAVAPDNETGTFEVDL